MRPPLRGRDGVKPSPVEGAGTFAGRRVKTDGSHLERCDIGSKPGSGASNNHDRPQERDVEPLLSGIGTNQPGWPVASEPAPYAFLLVIVWRITSFVKVLGALLDDLEEPALAQLG